MTLNRPAVPLAYTLQCHTRPQEPEPEQKQEQAPQRQPRAQRQWQPEPRCTLGRQAQRSEAPVSV